LKLKETPDFIIEYDDQLDALRHTIMNHDIDLAGWQDLLLTGTEYIEKHGCRRWLSDNRKLGSHSQETEQWINGVWLPRTIDAGWNTWALVRLAGSLTQLQYSRFVLSFAEMGVTARVFETPEEAEAWLRKVQTK